MMANMPIYGNHATKSGGSLRPGVGSETWSYLENTNYTTMRGGSLRPGVGSET